VCRSFVAPEMISWSLLGSLSSVTNLSRQSFMFVFYVPSSLRDETSNLSCHKSTLCLLLAWKTKRAISQSEGHFLYLLAEHKSVCSSRDRISCSLSDAQSVCIRRQAPVNWAQVTAYIEVSSSLIGWRTGALCLDWSGFVPNPIAL